MTQLHCALKQDLHYKVFSTFYCSNSRLMTASFSNVIFIMSKSYFPFCVSCELYGKIINKFPPGHFGDSLHVQCEELVIIIFDCFIKICGCWHDGMTWKLFFSVTLQNDILFVSQVSHRIFGPWIGRLDGFEAWDWSLATAPVLTMVTSEKPTRPTFVHLSSSNPISTPRFVPLQGI